MWLPLVGLLIGLIIGSIFSITIPVEYTRYTALAILASLAACRRKLSSQIQL